MSAHGSPAKCISCRCAECKATAVRLVREKRVRNATHGVYTSYNLGCRCSECSAAHARYRHGIAQAASPEDVPHGTSYGYGVYACRCEECLNAIRKDRGTKRPRKTFAQAEEADAATPTPSTDNAR